MPLWDHARDLASQAEGLGSQRGEMPSREQCARTSVSSVNLFWAPHPQTCKSSLLRLPSASRKQSSLTPCHPESSKGLLRVDRPLGSHLQKSRKECWAKEGEVKTSGLSPFLPFLCLPPILGTSDCTGVPTLQEILQLLQAQPKLLRTPSPQGPRLQLLSIPSHPPLPQFPKLVTAKGEGSLPDFCSTPSQSAQPTLTRPC